MQFHIPEDTSKSPMMDRPKCEVCNVRMWLARIKELKPGKQDKRTFECPVCATEKEEVVDYG